jgi:hypothetical protein
MPRQEQYIPSRYNAASVLEAHANGWWWNHFAFDLSTAEPVERSHPAAAGVLSRTLDVDFDHGEAATPGLGSIPEPDSG